jgi:hypothetical protein
MILVIVTLATFWAWDFLYHYASWIPGFLVYFIVPGMAYGFLRTPHQYLYPLAICAVVGLIHRVTQLPVSRVQTPVPRRRTNIPQI